MLVTPTERRNGPHRPIANDCIYLNMHESHHQNCKIEQWFLNSHKVKFYGKLINKIGFWWLFFQCPFKMSVSKSERNSKYTYFIRKQSSIAIESLFRMRISIKDAYPFPPLRLSAPRYQTNCLVFSSVGKLTLSTCINIYYQ